ncbi:MAG: enoyl-CoA hydratase/isomerase family protein [Acidimicrobiales bacterium]
MSSASFETIIASAEGPIGQLTLSRPAKLNPLSTKTLREIAHAARWFDDNRSVKVVIVSGAGTTFSAGADVSGFGNESGNDGLTAREAADTGREMAEAMEQMRAVTIAAVRGHCIGGGLVLAAACDLRIAADDTYFSIPEVDLGIPLAWGGIPRLVREIGPAMARELVLTCRPFSAEEAKDLGFLNRVVPADEVLAQANALAEELATKSSLTLQVTKRHVNAVLESMSNAGRNLADADSLVAALHDPESRERGAEYLKRVRKT